MGKWHYQLMHHTHDEMGREDDFYAIHEYYHLGDNENSWTEYPVTIQGDSPEEVKEILLMMLAALEANGVKNYDE